MEETKVNPLSLQIDPALFEPATDEEKRQADVMSESTSFFRDGMRRLMKNPLAVFSIIVLIAIIATILIAPRVVPYSYSEIITVNGRTLSDISEYERKKQQEKTPAEPVQTVDKVPTFEELYDAYQRRHANDHFTREAHKHLAEIARRRQRDEQERIAQTEERERKNRP